METIHCNHCYHFPRFSEPRRFFLSSCGHIFCGRCVSVVMCNDSCKMCGMRARVVEVNAHAKQEIKAYFMDPFDHLKDNFCKVVATFDQLKENFNKVGTILSFQKKHLRSALDKLGQMFTQENAYKEEIQRLKSENDRQQKIIDSMKERIEQLEQAEQSYIGGNPGFLVQHPQSETSFGSGLPEPFRQGPMMPIHSATATSATTPFFNSTNWQTPENQKRTTMGFIQPPAGSARSTSSAGSAGNPPVRYGPGRLTINRTPTIEEATRVPVSERFSPRVNQRNTAFTSRRGVSRPGGSDTFSTPINNTGNSCEVNLGSASDVVARLRQMKCLTETPGGRPPPPGPVGSLGSSGSSISRH